MLVQQRTAMAVMAATTVMAVTAVTATATGAETGGGEGGGKIGGGEGKTAADETHVISNAKTVKGDKIIRSICFPAAKAQQHGERAA
jgi:hypothetical protein